MAEILQMKLKHPVSAVWTQCLNADCGHRWLEVFDHPVRIFNCPECGCACNPGNCGPTR